MAYQRGSTRERLSLAEHFKSTLLRSVLAKGAGNVAYNVAKGLGFGTLSSFGIGQAAGLLATAIQIKRRKPSPPRRITRTQGKAGRGRRRIAGRVAKTSRRVAKSVSKTAVTEARKQFAAATRRAVREGLRVGTKEFGKRIRELMKK